MRLLFAGLGMVVLSGMAIAADAQQSADSPAIRPVNIQDSSRKPPVRKPVIPKPKPLRTELSGGLRLNTNGWSVFVDKGWVKDGDGKLSDLFYNLKLVQIEFSEIKHPKEMKQTNENQVMYASDKPRPFIYGKANNFYALNLGYGFRRMIAGKPEKGTVSIHWFGIGGLALGLLKPYYVDAYVPQDGGYLAREQIKYTDSSNGAFLNERLIIGGAGTTKGLKELKFIPGLQAKTGLHFDFASGKKTVLAIEVGLQVAYYTKKIEIMADQKAYPYNLNAFASFQFGKRW